MMRSSISSFSLSLIPRVFYPVLQRGHGAPCGGSTKLVAVATGAGHAPAATTDHPCAERTCSSSCIWLSNSAPHAAHRTVSVSGCASWTCSSSRSCDSNSAPHAAHVTVIVIGFHLLRVCEDCVGERGSLHPEMRTVERVGERQLALLLTDTREGLLAVDVADRPDPRSRGPQLVVHPDVSARVREDARSIHANDPRVRSAPDRDE